MTQFDLRDISWSVIEDDELIHVKSVAGFLQKEYGDAERDVSWSEDFLRWKLEASNPAGKGYLAFAECQGSVVGTMTLVLKRIWLDGQELIVGEIGDAYTHPDFLKPSMVKHARCTTKDTKFGQGGDYLNRSIFGRLATQIWSRAHADGIIGIYGTPNNKALPGWTKKLGYIVPDGAGIYSRVVPSVEMVLNKYKIAKPLRQPLSLFLKVCRFLALFTVGNPLKQYQIFKLEESAGSDFDQLWLRVRKNYQLSLVKDSAWVRWRYQSNPLAQYDIFVMKKEGEIVGWVVLRKFIGMGGVSCLAVADWLFDTDKDLATLFLKEVLRTKSYISDAIMIWSSDDVIFSSWLRRISFFRRRKVNVMFHRESEFLIDSFQLGKLQNAFTLGSSDNV